MFSRWLEYDLQKKIKAPYVHILFGARQTGKSTLIKKLIPNPTLSLDFSNPTQRTEYLISPGQLIQQCKGLIKKKQPAIVLVDEAQMVPSIFDAVQHLYDSDPKRWRFVMCGSSARKLRMIGANLLPGRSILHRLYPLVVTERPFPEKIKDPFYSPLPFSWKLKNHQPFPEASLLDRLTWGELPGLTWGTQSQRADLLNSYCMVYLEEELRREAMVKDWPSFARFLQFAAIESGQLINYSKISNEIGISVPTIKNYYQLLEDMFLGFRLPVFSKSERKNLLSTERFFFFDIGVRHAAARLSLQKATVQANPGPIFEQWVITEFWKRMNYLKSGSLHYLRSKTGMEIDLILDVKNRWIPIEIKWTEHPTVSDARHLLTFLHENSKHTSRGYVVCRCKLPMELHPKIMALPWHCI
jgi:predicted AAA+ superfamily ATPase